MIPPELSGIAADFVTLHDGLETERDNLETQRTALHAERATLHVAIGSAMRQRRVLTWSIGLHMFGFAAWVLATLAVVGRVGGP
jgi:hypothetical protein